MTTTPDPTAPAPPPAEMYQRISLIRDAFGFDLEEVVPVDGVNMLPIGPTYYQVNVPVPMLGTTVPVVVPMPGVTSIPDAFTLIRDKAKFIPMIQAAATEKEAEVRVALAKRQQAGPVIQRPGDMPGKRG